MPERLLVIACGALACEIVALKRQYGWRHLELKCLDARLHNRPQDIPGAVAAAIRRHGAGYDRVFVAYADCGTGGTLDRVLRPLGIERLPGAHCYQLFAGAARFEALAAAEPGTFYLTDFLARHFDRLVIRPLGLDVHPELRIAYFGNYRRLVYLAQSRDPQLLRAARRAAERLSLDFETLHCGYGELETALPGRATDRDNGQDDSRLLA